MKHEFWLERWEQNQIGFHQSQINRYLTDHWAELGLAAGARVFVPLCGKSLDLLWLRGQGHSVLGIELSRKAVEAFFSDNKLHPVVSNEGRFIRYREEGLCILVGDFFALTPEDLGDIQAVYDRAALIALPPEMRMAYARQMAALLPSGAQMLLVTMEYPPGTLQGPPFSVSSGELRSLYSADFTLELKTGLEEAAGPGGSQVTEQVHILVRR